VALWLRAGGRRSRYHGDIFRDALGFTVGWSEATDWRLLSRSAVNLIIGGDPDTTPAREIGDQAMPPISKSTTSTPCTGDWSNAA
jgi:hypothetical protein